MRVEDVHVEASAQNEHGPVTECAHVPCAGERVWRGGLRFLESAFGMGLVPEVLELLVGNKDPFRTQGIRLGRIERDQQRIVGHRQRKRLVVLRPVRRHGND
jgi:hypothetical protein